MAAGIQCSAIRTRITTVKRARLRNTSHAEIEHSHTITAIHRPYERNLAVAVIAAREIRDMTMAVENELDPRMLLHKTCDTVAESTRRIGACDRNQQALAAANAGYHVQRIAHLAERTLTMTP